MCTVNKGFCLEEPIGSILDIIYLHPLNQIVK